MQILNDPVNFSGLYHSRIINNEKQKMDAMIKFQESHHSSLLSILFYEWKREYSGSEIKILRVILCPYSARYFPSRLIDITEAGFLRSLLCPILFHVLISQTAVTALSPV